MPIPADRDQNYQTSSNSNQSSSFVARQPSSAHRLPHELLTSIVSSAVGTPDQPVSLGPCSNQDSPQATAMTSLLIDKPFYFAGIEVRYGNNQLHFSSNASLSSFVEHTGIDLSLIHI